MNFPRLSTASVNGKQHLSKVFLVLLLDFHCKENDDFRIQDSQDMLDSTNSDSDFMNTIITVESWVYGYDPVTKLFRHFPYNESPTRALLHLNAACYQLTLLTGGKKLHVCI